MLLAKISVALKFRNIYKGAAAMECTYPQSRRYLFAAACWAVASSAIMFLVVLLFPVTQFLSDQMAVPIIFSLVFLTLVFGTVAQVLWLPLKCSECGMRVKTKMSRLDKPAPSYAAREKNRSLANQITNIFLPEELRLNTMHCIHCDHAFHLDWKG